MVRITVTTDGEATAIRVEGRLVRASGEELRACWQRLRTERAVGRVCLTVALE
jgi:hypothetical protein